MRQTVPNQECRYRVRKTPPLTVVSDASRGGDDGTSINKTRESLIDRGVSPTGREQILRLPGIWGSWGWMLRHMEVVEARLAELVIMKRVATCDAAN